MTTSWNGYAYSKEWTDFLNRFQQNEQAVKSLGDQVAALQKQLEEMKASPSIHVEYHFDQLKVNRLDGTLNVGLSPQGINGLGSLETPVGGTWNMENQSSSDTTANASKDGDGSGAGVNAGVAGAAGTDVGNAGAANAGASAGDGGETQLKAILGDMQRYMREADDNVLVSMAQSAGVMLDVEQRRRVIADVSAQLPERIRYYVHTTPFPAEGSEAERVKWKSGIEERTVRDIQSAFSAYLRNFNRNRQS